MKPALYLPCLLPAILLVACQTSQNSQTSTTLLPADDAKVTLSVSAGRRSSHQAYQTLGYQEGKKVPDIALFSAEGDPFMLSEVLAQAKPLILISGSYTCDVSRHNSVDINTLMAKYKNKATIYVVYTIDAHPSDCPGPYTKGNKVELATVNRQEHIAARQPKTYGERKILAKKWQQQSYISAPMLIDKPTNDFWLAFGQAPNMAYSIDPDGTVYFKQAWFDYVSFDAAIQNWFRTGQRSTMSP